MHSASLARLWHGSVAALGVFALGTQVILVGLGVSVLVEGEPPSLAARLVRFFSYFTVQSNILVLWASLSLTARPSRDGTGWRVLRFAGLMGIVVTGVVHWLLLRPLLDLDGWRLLTDHLLHIVVPIGAVLGWLLFGPRPRVTVRVFALALVWPIVWVIWTLVVGQVTSWYPYPFLDVSVQGPLTVALSVALITTGFLLTGALLVVGDTTLPATHVGPRAQPETSPDAATR